MIAIVQDKKQCDHCDLGLLTNRSSKEQGFVNASFSFILGVESQNQVEEESVKNTPSQQD